MKRRDFLSLGLTATAVGVAAKSLSAIPAFAADAKKDANAKKDAGPTIAEKDILKEGQPATIANYCETPDKQPNKFCGEWKTKPGHCKECTFFNKDNSLGSFKGRKYARCQLLTDPKKPQFVAESAWCATFVKQA